MTETVYLVDDDPDVLDAVTFLLEADGYRVEAFADPFAALKALGPDHRGCLVLDVRLPGMTGLELHQKLRQQHVLMPVLFISGHGDIPLAVRAINAGALDFIEKPFHDMVLLEKVANAIELDGSQYVHITRQDELEARLERLTPRERQVMEAMMQGKLNKVIADELDVSPRTVEVHRARVLDKLEARNSSDMVRLVLSTERYRDWLL
ncbi:response regulator [Methylonatrum kenyense]|uniref:response regulator transcription factor n=1 Tax=Methylonatrum kenyense TaxID=455253 RepID=UPI0020C13E73|nr:response regulator [Methylonatrum kenyense]MCK8514796.1 response regulator [Methylonatrum kenyense]